jgi:hypothetical protein
MTGTEQQNNLADTTGILANCQVIKLELRRQLVQVAAGLHITGTAQQTLNKSADTKGILTNHQVMRLELRRQLVQVAAGLQVKVTVSTVHVTDNGALAIQHLCSRMYNHQGLGGV